MLQFGGCLSRFHPASDSSRNNKHSTHFLWCSRFYGKDQGRVALEPILFSSNFWQILAVVALDEQVLTKASLIDMHVTRSTELTLRRFSLRCMFLTLRSPATRDFQPLIGRTVSLGLLTFVLLAPLAIEEDYVAEAISSNCCQ